MSSKPYIKNQKDPGGSRYLCAQDEEDYEQDKLIQQWLEREGKSGEIELAFINRKGTARNTIDQRSIRLDQKVRDEPDSRTYADLIAGSDGRDLECRLDFVRGDEPPEKSAADLLDEQIDLFFDAIGASEGVKEWARKSLKSAESLRSLRSQMKDDEPLEISMTNLESLRPFHSFRK